MDTEFTTYYNYSKPRHNLLRCDNNNIDVKLGI